MDTREVSLCSTIHPVYSGETVLRWQKMDGTKQKISIPRSTAITEYNKYMRGLNTSDQMIGTNLVHHKTKRWTTTVFQHLVDIMVTNSFVIHKVQSASMQQRPLTRQGFQEELAAHLLGVDLKGKPETTGGPCQHLPVPTGTGLSKAQMASGERRRCKVCHRSTPWKCEGCDVGLCLLPDRNCHWQYHQS